MKEETLLEKVCQNEDKQHDLVKESGQTLFEALKLWIDKTGLIGIQFKNVFEELPIVVNGFFGGDEIVLRRAYITHITLSDNAEIEDMSVIDDCGKTYYMTPQEIFDDDDTIIDFNKLTKIILKRISSIE